MKQETARRSTATAAYRRAHIAGISQTDLPFKSPVVEEVFTYPNTIYPYKMSILIAHQAP
jgi:hypothetical protein